MQKLCLSSALKPETIQKFGALYEKHYDIKLSADGAEQKLGALLELLDAVRGGADQDCAAADRLKSTGHSSEYYCDQFPKIQKW